MYLKRIELSGFKSFCDDTKLEFSPGICVVVGPNGCGKSNIVDAVCWAMGEQGLRPLRAKNPEDLIFVGSRDLPADPSAEVSMVFDNQDGSAPPEYNQFSEIEITRRIHRTGESEFLINRGHCRLKDITEFFLGTGLGKQAYSVIEQGEIDRILQAKPEEIRGLVEEAAGISKYRFRRDEALKKMQATRENLTRIRDIIGELKTQLNSLSRQAKKAVRYHLYKNELQETENEICCHRGLELKAKIEKISRALEAENAEMENLQAQFAKLEIELEEKRASLELLDGGIRSEQERKLELNSRMQNLASEAALLGRQEEAEKFGIRARQKESETLAGQVEQLEREIQTRARQKEELEFEISSVAADLEAKTREAEARLQEFQKCQNAFASLAGEIQKIDQELARLGEKERSLVWQEARLKDEQEQNQARLTELEPLIQGERQRSFDFNQNLHQLRKNLAEFEEKFQADQLSMEKLRQLIAAKTGRGAEIKSHYQTLSAKIESLKEMMEKLEGFERGVKYILEKKRKEPAVNGFYGLVAELVETEPGYEQAVEAVLGERIQSVVVDSPEQGLEAVNCLMSESAGRGTFIPRAPRDIVPAEIPEHLRRQGARPLAELVRVQKGFEPVVSYLLGQAVLVSDLNQAVNLWQQNGFKGAFVTKQGAVLDPAGVLTGGSKDQAGFLSKKRELKELELEKAELNLRMEEAEKELALLHSQLLAQEEEFDHLRNRINHLKLDVATQEKDLRHATEELNEKTDSLEKCRLKADELAEQISQANRDRAELLRRKTELAAELENFGKERESLLAEINLAQNAQKRADEEKNSLITEKARLQEKALGLEEARAGLQKSLQDHLARKAQLVSELEQAEKNMVEFKARLAQIQEERVQTIQVQEAQNQKQADLEARRKVLAEESSQAQARLKELDSRVRDQAGKLNACSLELEKEKLGLDNLKQLVSKIHQQELEAVIAACRERVSSPEFAVAPREARAEELRHLIQRMGEVNPTALEEYKELETRYSFLANQEADLVSALEKLEQTISKVNQEYRKQFQDTFAEVNKIFTDLFPKLFGGGKALLHLTDENNLLETGVEIIAQPPGKKLQSISLLSGGEKSLAAIALVFSLYLNRPSPFCLLDEVDSALDEVNIDRFNHLLKSLAEKSQILIVTHNKRTMELADLLYGVTMEKPGVSRVVSVKLEQLKDDNSFTAR